MSGGLPAEFPVPFGLLATMGDLVQVYRGATPPDISSQNRDLDEAWTAASILWEAYLTVLFWSYGINVYSASGTQLDAQATNEGLRRQGGESDTSLQARLRTPPDAVTRTAILTAVQQIVDANGGGICYLLELPRDAGYLNRTSYMSRNARMGASRTRMVIALIPASAHCLESCTDALRSKVSAAKEYLVQEYTR